MGLFHSGRQTRRLRARERAQKVARLRQNLEADKEAWKAHPLSATASWTTPTLSRATPPSTTPPREETEVERNARLDREEEEYQEEQTLLELTHSRYHARTRYMQIKRSKRDLLAYRVQKAKGPDPKRQALRIRAQILALKAELQAAQEKMGESSLTLPASGGEFPPPGLRVLTPPSKPETPGNDCPMLRKPPRTFEDMLREYFPMDLAWVLSKPRKARLRALASAKRKREALKWARTQDAAYRASLTRRRASRLARSKGSPSSPPRAKKKDARKGSSKRS